MHLIIPYLPAGAALYSSVFLAKSLIMNNPREQKTRISSALLRSVDVSLGLFFVCLTLLRFQEYLSLSLPQGSDLAWLIRIGDQILDGKSANSSQFSWLYPQQTIISYQWLFECLVSLINRYQGLWTIGLLSNLAGAIFLFCLLPSYWLRLNIPFSITFLFVWMLPSRYWQFPRPQSSALILLYILIVVFEKLKSNPHSKWIWSLPFITLLWANIHLTWSFALLFILIQFVFLLLKDRKNKQALIRFASVFLCCIGSIFINPNAAEMISHATSFADGSQYLRIHEVLPAYNAPDLIPFLMYSFLALAVFLTNWSKLFSADLIIALIGLGLGLQISRFEPIAVLCSWNLLGQAISDFCKSKNLESFSNTIINSFWIKRSAILALLSTLVLWFAHCPNNEAAVRKFVVCDPRILALPQERGKTRLFNEPVIGSWMIYQKVGIPLLDNHFDIYPKSFVQKVSQCLSAEEGWQSYLDEIGADSILIPKSVPLYKAVEASSVWQKGAEDRFLSYYERKK